VLLAMDAAGEPPADEVHRRLALEAAAILGR
jgi:hypothetical protein